MNQLVPFNHNEIPLGTADWQGGLGSLRPYRANGFLLGHDGNGQPVGLADDRHVLLVGGTRAGKGASVLIPNLCAYPGSVVVIDPKGENAIVTARRRANGSRYSDGMGQKVVLLDPFHAVQTPDDSFADLRGGFNPLDLVRPDRPASIDDANRIADALVVSEGSKDPYWEESARAFIKAVILHVASAKDYEGRRNLVTVRALLMAGDTARQTIAGLSGGKKAKTTGLGLLFAAMTRNPAFNGAVAQAGAMFGNLETNATRTMANIAQIACTNTEFIESPGMQACLTRSTFHLHELKTDAGGVSLYLSLPTAFMDTHYRWLRMVVTLLTGEMERYRQSPATGHPVLMVLDEFPALRRMKVIENAAAQIAGFGVRLVLAVQTLPQLKDIYKDNWETLVANAGVKLFFGNDDHFTRDYASKLVGEREIVRIVTTVSETTGTTTSTAKGTTRGSTLTDTWGLTEGSQNVSFNKGGSQASAYSRTDTETNGTSSSRTVARAETLHKRPLVTPDEIGRLFGNRDRLMALALVSGHQPMALARQPYYRMPSLSGCFDWHPEHARPETRQARQLRLQREDAANVARHCEELRQEQLQFARWRAEDERDAARRARADAKERRHMLLGAVCVAAIIAGSAWSVTALLGSGMLLLPAITTPKPKRRSITGYVPRDATPPRFQLRVRTFWIAVAGMAAFAISASPSGRAFVHRLLAHAAVLLP